MTTERVSQTFLLADPFLIRKISTDPHILGHENTDCPDDRYPKFKMCISELNYTARIHTGCIRNNVMHDLTLIKLAVTRFVGTGGFLVKIL